MRSSYPIFHDTRPSELLSNLIQSNVFAGKVEQWLDADMRGRVDGFYAKNVLSYGIEEAEARLALWVEKRGFNAFADAVEQTACGLYALAELDDRVLESADATRTKPFVRVLPIGENSRLLGADYHHGGFLVLADNPQVPGCGCNQPEGSMQFGRGGEIGLRSVGIMLDVDLGNPTVLLLLPHPNYRTGSSEETRLGYAAVTIDTTGHSSGYRVQYYLNNNVLAFGLGEVGVEQLVGGSTMGPDIRSALDFPGSEAYLASCIPQLGSYLENAAAKLSGQHSH